MNDYKEVVDQKDHAELSQEVTTELNLHLEMGIRQIQGKVLIWWNLPDKWIMCDKTNVNIYDYKGRWVKAWRITPKHKGEILTEFAWGTGWSANLYAYPPGALEIQIMRTAQIKD